MLIWQDGQPFSRQFSDIYFSSDSGMKEKRHVFLEGNRLPERLSLLSSGVNFTVGETGFGTGLNFLSTWQLFDQVALSNNSLDYFSVEKYPLEERDLRDVLSLWPMLQQYSDQLLARWRRRIPGWNRWCFDGGKIRLTLMIGDVLDALTGVSGGVDAWFLDGFSPARNPEMWTQPVFENVVRSSKPGASFATYTCAGWVRRGLEQVGFQVSKSPGYGSKREMLQGRLPGLSSAQSSISKAIVIGGGLAGCSVAAAFAMRGISVTLFERASELAAAASGNPRGVLHLRLNAGNNSLQRFLLASYGYALALLDEKLPIDGIGREECGELQLAFSAQESKRIDQLAKLDWPTHLLHQVNAAEASRLAGVELAYGGLWFPSGGWLVPPKLCDALAKNPGITKRTGHQVESLTAVDGGWRVTVKDELQQTCTYDTQVVVVCTGYQVKSFAQLSHLPVTPVRGQISFLPASLQSEKLRTIICANGYFSPSSGGMHVLGATHGFNDEGVDLRASDHAENLSKLAGISSMLAKSLKAKKLGGRASVRASVPGAMPLVGELLPGLYTSLGHGTRGIITSGLSGELIAAMACGQLLPLPQNVVSALAPVPAL